MVCAEAAPVPVPVVVAHAVKAKTTGARASINFFIIFPLIERWQRVLCLNSTLEETNNLMHLCKLFCRPKLSSSNAFYAVKRSVLARSVTFKTFLKICAFPKITNQNDKKGLLCLLLPLSITPVPHKFCIG